MKVLNKFTLLNMRMNIRRSLATIFGVTIAAALMLGIGIFFSSYRDSLIEDQIDQYGDYHVIIDNFDYSKISIYEKNNDIEKTMILNYIDTMVLDSDFLQRSIILCSFSDYQDYIVLKKGGFPNNNDEIIIADQYASYANVAIGSTVNINEVAYRVSGIYKNSKILNTHDRNAYIFYTKFQKNNELNSTFYIKLKNENKAYQKIENLAESLSLKGQVAGYRKTYENVTVREDFLSLYGQSYNYGLYAILVISIMLISTILALFCIFSIYNSFAISIVERKKTFGILSSIGATKGQILKSVFFEAFIVTILAIPLAFIFSIIFSLLAMGIINRILLEFTTLQFHIAFYPLFIFIPMIFIVVMVFLAALFPAKRASEVTPIEAIRMHKDIKYKVKRNKLNNFFLKIWGVEGELARKNIKRNKRKYRITIISLVLSMVLFTVFTNYINILYGGIELGDYSYEYDVSLSITTDNQVDLDKITNQVINITDNMKYTTSQRLILKNINPDLSLYTSEYLENYITYKNHLIIAVLLDDVSYQQYYQTIGLTSKRPIFINECSNQADYSIFNNNDSISLSLGNNDIIYKEITDVYLTDTKNSNLQTCGYLYVDKELFAELLEIKNSYSERQEYSIGLLIESDEFKEIDNKVQQILTDYPDYDIYYENNKLFLHQQKMYFLVIKFCIYAFIFFITLVGVTSVFNTINTSINLRRTEFAVLRSIGITPRKFNKMIYFESIFLGIKTLIYGIIVSLGLIYITKHIFELENYLKDIKVPFPKNELIIATIGIILIIFTIMQYSIRKIKKYNIIDEIRKDNI